MKTRVDGLNEKKAYHMNEDQKGFTLIEIDMLLDAVDCWVNEYTGAAPAMDIVVMEELRDKLQARKDEGVG